MAPTTQIDPVRAADLLKKAVRGYCEVSESSLKAGDRETLKILAADRVVAKAFAAFSPDGRYVPRILSACLEAKELKRDFEGWIDHERAVLERMGKLEKAAAQLRVFAEELSKGPRNRLAAWIHRDPAEWKTIVNSLRIIGSDASARRRIARETLPRIGVGRKVTDTAETRAIGWLAAAIAHITGQPHTNDVAYLATIVLGLKELCSSDRVVKARKSLDKNWRNPPTRARANKKGA